MDLAIHHVSVPVRDLLAASQFYEGVLGFQRLPRPSFPVAGLWYKVGDRQIHLVVHPGANFRNGKPVDNDDVHFALNTADFEGAYAHLKLNGYSEDLPGGHPKRLILKRTGAAGFAQVFFMDPDFNIIEINTAPFC
ncbi:VOC family protein [Aestuariivirga sp.]|uniref:VOC family protein n=1 Tax=Aestuariivirga sp. TaxID=2650926 RepID=UPI0039E607FD